MGARKREEPLTIFTIVSLVVFCISVLLYSSFGSMLSQKSFYRFVLAEDSSNVGVDWSVSANSGENEINLFWEDTFPDVLYRVAIDKGSGFGKGHPVGDSTHYTFKDLEAGKDYVLKIAAFSEDGQELSHVTIRAATEEIQEVFPGDVVINEIAWMGTSASSYDEWIELYSNTNKDLDLAGWLLVAEDGTPEIELEGQIPAGGYFLLERTDETTVSDIEADFIYTGALGNDGEHLKLVDSSGQVVDEIDCLEGWFAGVNDSKHSMERLLPEEDGSSETNWMSNDGETVFGKDANEYDILGTPKHQNSVYGAEYVVEEEEERKIEFEVPSTVHIEDPFEVEVRVQNFDSDSSYYVKVLAAENEKFYHARTLSKDETKWLAWNASWSDFPYLETDNSGDAELKVQAKIKEESLPGEFRIKIRLRKVPDGVNIDSEEKQIMVEPVLHSGVVLAATKLPETAPPKEFSELAGKVFVCVGAALHLFLQSSKSS